MSRLTELSKPIIISALAVLAVAGVSFAVQPAPADEPTVTPNATHVQQPAATEDQSSTPRQTAQEPVQTPNNSGAASVSDPSEQASTQPQTSSEAPAVDAPIVQPAPVTLVQVIGSGVTTNARPYIDSFTCTYSFSDGTSQSRSVVYGKDELDHAAAVCPSWE